MKLKFYWYFDGVNLLSSCEIFDTSEKTINCLSGVLTDDGALSGYNKISWLSEGLRRFENITTVSNIPIFWNRDSWGSEYIGENTVRLYSMYDDNYFVDLSLKIFIKILRDWLEFNISEPNINNILNFEF